MLIKLLTYLLTYLPAEFLWTSCLLNALETVLDLSHSEKVLYTYSFLSIVCLIKFGALSGRLFELHAILQCAMGYLEVEALAGASIPIYGWR